MLRMVAAKLKDVSTLRRLLFATVHIPRDLPNFWGVVVEFATFGEVDRSRLGEDEARMLVENMEEFESRAFATDKVLLQELVGFKPSKGRAFGLVLISPESSCVNCGGKLILRKDRPASLVLYDDNIGAVPASHFHKYCSNHTCSVTQYYGYYTTGGNDLRVIYNANWSSLPYFVASRETVFSTSLLERLDSEVMIGQISYQQRANIFNDVHRCCKLSKESTR